MRPWPRYTRGYLCIYVEHRELLREIERDRQNKQESAKKREKRRHRANDQPRCACRQRGCPFGKEVGIGTSILEQQPTAAKASGTIVAIFFFYCLLTLLYHILLLPRNSLTSSTLPGIKRIPSSRSQNSFRQSKIVSSIGWLAGTTVQDPFYIVLDHTLPSNDFFRWFYLNDKSWSWWNILKPNGGFHQNQRFKSSITNGISRTWRIHHYSYLLIFNRKPTIQWMIIDQPSSLLYHFRSFPKKRQFMAKKVQEKWAIM